MVIILFPVAFPYFIIVPDYIMHHGPHILIIPQGHMAVIGIHKYFRFQLRVFRFVYIQTNASPVKITIAAFKILQGIPDRIQDMFFGIPGNGILQAPELRARIAAEGLCRPLGQK